MNTVIISGNLTRDVEMRATASGLQVANGRLAVNNRKKNGDEWVDDPVFIDVVAFGDKAERFGQDGKKGERVYVQGRLSQSEWEKDGVKKSKIEVLSDRIEVPNRPAGTSRTIADQAHLDQLAAAAGLEYVDLVHMITTPPPAVDSDIPF